MKEGAGGAGGFAQLISRCYGKSRLLESSCRIAPPPRCRGLDVVARFFTPLLPRPSSRCTLGMCAHRGRLICDAYSRFSL